MENSIQTTFEKQSFGKRLKSMLKVDFKRMFTMPLVYIMAGVGLVLPILILVMTSMMGGGATAEAGAEGMGTFTNVWQAIGSTGSGMSMDLTSMCNINMMFFLVGIFVCIFVADDFKSGYAKNLFAVRAKKTDYCISKSAAGFTGGAIMVAMYFVGAMIGGAIAELPFDTGTASAGGIAACLFSKVFMTAVFVAIALLLAVVGKQKLWLSILCSIGASMLLYTMIPTVAPLNATVINVIMCLVGGGLFCAGSVAASGLILNKTSLV